MEFHTIKYTPGWYYKKWPGFYNEECYQIMARYSSHPEEFTNPTVPEHVENDVEMEQTAENGVEEMKENIQDNKNCGKRKQISSEECDLL